MEHRIDNSVLTLAYNLQIKDETNNEANYRRVASLGGSNMFHLWKDFRMIFMILKFHIPYNEPSYNQINSSKMKY